MLHLVDTTLTDLEDAGCIELGGEDGAGGGQTQSRGEEVRRAVAVVNNDGAVVVVGGGVDVGLWLLLLLLNDNSQSGYQDDSRFHDLLYKPNPCARRTDRSDRDQGNLAPNLAL